MQKKVLIACEESQTICLSFRSLGVEAYSCDLLPCSGGHPEYHLQSDVNLYLDYPWDLIIAHPPCTYLSNAGARWMHQAYPYPSISVERFHLMQKARDFFMLFYNSDCKHVCIENPTPLKICNLPNASQVIQPYQFGHPFSKRTCLWLKGLPLLKPTDILPFHRPFLPSNTSHFYKYGSGGSSGFVHNSFESSKTFKGIALAMATQWLNSI